MSVATSARLPQPTTGPRSVATGAGPVLYLRRPDGTAVYESRSTPGKLYHTKITGNVGICDCPSFCFGNRWCLHLVREQMVAGIATITCPQCHLNPIKDHRYCSERCAETARMEAEAFAVHVIAEEDRGATDPHPEQPFCHCTNCGARYDFTEFSPLHCPQCDMAHVGVTLAEPAEYAELVAEQAAVGQAQDARYAAILAESTAEEIAVTEAAKGAALETLLGITRECRQCGQTFLGTASLCVDCLYPELAGISF